eukprot:gb/GEZN01010189.1/.p1 GENE.gb/GEZN01010189.1/~~gb/GEZN01010189.1/.p1  ORF type:complete len:363 (+),score=60.00 gb/GEZN01010189.1/:60-1148(+)
MHVSRFATAAHFVRVQRHTGLLIGTREMSGYGSGGMRGGVDSHANFCLRIVKQQTAVLVERFGKYNRTLTPGLHFLLPPPFETIRNIHNLREQAITIPNQTAVTMDNVAITVDGVLYFKIHDAHDAEYNTDNVYFMMTQLAQTTMRSELGKMTLDKTFAEREHLNVRIVESINAAAAPWGTKCLRYEIRDIQPPSSVKHAMELQAEAERKKRAAILDSEGQRQAEINAAEGARRAAILRAEGLAQATILQAEATALSIKKVADVAKTRAGQKAVALRVADQYITAWGNVAKKGTTVLLPSNVGDPSAMIAQALGMYDAIVNKKHREGEQEHTEYADEEEEEESDVPPPPNQLPVSSGDERIK